eukprot:CAMPEP_0179196082 /NCGR_PEP_ID=MMETSP0796-20121207/97489_1 /TAXON_ID=73915 /ORGANISM="Pyrodinium bahamense, Strain pbaha01" /LENGTH=45 /DNA_ID= /DNA_START= /DNA_END= /DNA_ORIENTATION=
MPDTEVPIVSRELVQTHVQVAIGIGAPPGTGGRRSDDVPEAGGQA